MHPLASPSPQPDGIYNIYKLKKVNKESDVGGLSDTDNLQLRFGARSVEDILKSTDATLESRLDKLLIRSGSSHLTPEGSASMLDVVDSIPSVPAAE